MPERQSHAPGAFCWPEIATTDLKRAKEFYGELFGWDIRATTGGFYNIAHLRNFEVAGLYQLMPDQMKQGVPAHWMAYVSVVSADATVKSAVALGAKVHAAPFDVGDIGCMAVLEDPTGATFALWEPKGMCGVALVDEPGAATWYEIATTDGKKARAFYEALFGWTAKVSPGYVEFTLGGAFVAGMAEMGKDESGIPPHWRVYVQVADCDAVAKSCAALGGKVHVGPMDIPGVGRFAVLNAPDGAYFSVLRREG